MRFFVSTPREPSHRIPIALDSAHVDRIKCSPHDLRVVLGQYLRDLPSTSFTMIHVPIVPSNVRFDLSNFSLTSECPLLWSLTIR